MAEPQNNNDMTFEQVYNFVQQARLYNMTNSAYDRGTWDVLIICGYEAWRCHRELLTRRCSFFRRYLPPIDPEDPEALVNFQLPAVAAGRIESLVLDAYEESPENDISGNIRNMQWGGGRNNRAEGPVIAEEREDGIIVEIVEARHTDSHLYWQSQQRQPQRALQQSRRPDFGLDDRLFLHHPQSYNFLF